MTATAPALGLAFTDERTVVTLAQAGDERAFAELVNRRQSSVRNLLRRLSRDASLADDLAQETFLQAWRQMKHLRAPGAFGGWLRQVAVNTWLQHVRARVPEIAWREDLVGAREASVATAVDLDGALSQLAPDARLCVVLAYHEGLTHSEIATTTGLPLGTVKSHVARGAARLQEILKSYAGQSCHEQ